MTAGTAAHERESIRADLGQRVKRWPRSPVFYGIVVATLAVIVGEYLGVSPPAAYGLCSACHGRDLADWIVNHTEANRYLAKEEYRKPWSLPKV